MIKKVGSNYQVVSHTTGRVLGTYKTKEEAEKRLKQIQFFKNLQKSKGTLLKKIKQKAILLTLKK